MDPEEPDEFAELLARVSGGEVVARPELVKLAMASSSSSEDIKTWAERLATDLAEIHD